MTRVVVTGGSGKLGVAVVEELSGAGYDVVNLDRVPPPDGAPGSYTRVDFTDYGQTVEALRAIDERYTGVDALVHLAAIPGPGIAPNAVTFTNNITASYHVFSAARAAGVRNIVWASSETLLGLPFTTPPPYLPVDEEYPARPETSYALAKHLEEQLAQQLCRWDPQLKMYGLRFSNVMAVEDYARFPSFEDDLASRRWNAWSYIDRRDGARAVRLALEHDGHGFEVFVIANTDSVLSRPTAEAIAAEFPDTPIRVPFTGTEAGLSSAKARQVLGFEPRHSWREHVSGH